MTSGLPGISGTLFPGRFLADAHSQRHSSRARASLDPRAFLAWWRDVESTCGPATSVREIFDVAASPLAGLLGFRARDVTFGSRAVTASLVTHGGARVGLVVLPWAKRRSGTWRDLAAHAQRIGASWSLLLSPPHLSVVDARGHGLRQSVDFVLPAALDPRSLDVFAALTSAPVFEGAPPAVDRWVADGRAFQDRVREDLQLGVAASLTALADRTGASAWTRRRGRSSGDPFDEALTIVYRILFLLFAESRDAVPRRNPIYGPSYSVAALCAEAWAGGERGLAESLAAISRLARAGLRTGSLSVSPFNGRLFARASAPTLERHRTGRRGARHDRRDRAIARTLVALGTRAGRAGREEISYADLGVEQLGAVYERVLDLDPTRGLKPGRPIGPARGAHSARRKSTGTFYTPQCLADFVVRRTLAPLTDGLAADDILALRIVDPAMGSGAFLVSACRFLADAYEHALVEEGRLSEADVDEETRADHRRLVAERCLAGVDSNPVAVQVAQLSIWLATLARGRPLGFLDHRLRVGNSLVGTTPEAIRFVTDVGRGSRVAATPLFDAAGIDQAIEQVSRPLTELVTRRDETVVDVRAKAAIWRRLTSEGSPLEPWRLAASLWCARWFSGEKTGAKPPSPAELRAALDGLLRDDRTLPAGQLDAWIDRARRIARDRGFFHWPLEYPDVFRGPDGAPRERPGFDAVIGNPPWEMLRLESGMNVRDGVERRELREFLRESGQYGRSGRSHINLYLPFVERALALTRAGGRVGLVLPWGFAVDDGAAALRQRLVERGELDTIVGLDNAEALFPIHRGVRFLVMVAGAARSGREVRARFGVRRASEIEALPGRGDGGADAAEVRLDAHTLWSVGGRTHRIPDVRRPGDLALLLLLSRRAPRLGAGDGLGATFGRDLNATDDRGSLGRTGLPVLEGKHIAPFVADVAAARSRIASAEAARLLPDDRHTRARLAYRDVSGVGNRVTLIAAMLPAGVVTTHTLFCLRPALALPVQHYLCGVMNSYVLNAVVRMLMGGHLTTSLVEDLPVPAWTGSPGQREIARIAARLAGWPATPGRNDRRRDKERLDRRRSVARLQATVARLYGLDAARYRHVLDGFPLVPADERAEALAAFE